MLSNFKDVSDLELRTQNRGAVMANLFEDYYRDCQTASYSFKTFLESIDEYLEGVPLKEVVKAKEAMKLHLIQRGYRYGS